MPKKTRLRDLMPRKSGYPYQPSNVRDPGAQIRKPAAPVRKLRPQRRRGGGGGSRRYF